MSDCRFGVSPVNYPDPVPVSRMLNSMTRLVTHFTLEIKQSVTPVKSMAALEEELSKLLNPTPVFKDPEDYSDEGHCQLCKI